MSHTSRISSTIKQIPYGKTIVIAPLNWGLGHASRCIPIINQALSQNNKIIIASDGLALSLLRKEYPSLTYYELPSYHIQYHFNSVLFNLIVQSPRILKAIWKEKKSIKRIIAEENVDLIISDNRYGCLSSECESIFLTHQLHIHTGNSFTCKIANFVNRLLLRKHDNIWVPDFQGESSLAGSISQKYKAREHQNILYIGPLSRISKCKSSGDPIYDILCLLSGPEPQRSKLENVLVGILESRKQQTVLVRGTDLPFQHENNSKIKVLDFATTEQIQELLCYSRMVVSRSGYSTIMDLFSSGNQAILIPTPGQVEQEFLAKNLEHHDSFWFINQKDLNEKSLSNLLDQ